MSTVYFADCEGVVPYRGFAETHAHIYVTGKGLDVLHLPQPGGRTTICTHQRADRVDIRGDAEAYYLGVLDGSVSLSSTATQRTVTIPARWGARVEPGRDPVPARVWSQAEFDAVIARTSAE